MIFEMRRKTSHRLRPAALGLIGAIVLMFAVVGVASAANSPRPRQSIAVGVTAQELTVRITAKSHARCARAVTTKHKSSTFPPLYTTKSGHAVITWSVPTDAPSGDWKFEVACKTGRHTYRTAKKLLLINHGNGHGGITTPDSVKVTTGLLGGGKGMGPCAALSAPDQYGHCVGFPGDPYNGFADPNPGDDVGQCTWYAAGRRPDLWGIERLWAARWLSDAQAAHVPTGTVPRPGAIAVRTLGQWGHVAYVVSASGSTVWVDDSNYYNDVTVRYDHPVPAGYFQGYIYGGPAGNGPGGGGPGPSAGSPAPSGGTSTGRPPSPVGYAQPVSFVDSNGNLNVFINSGSGINHYVKPSGGSWSGEVIVQGNVGSAAPDAFEAPNGNLEVFINSGTGINHYEKAPGGSWGGEIVASGNVGSVSPDAFAESNGSLDVFINSGSGINHYVKPPGGSWSGEIVASG
jgi:hypothetical protein